MCKTEKESYEKYWDDISPFIKFGCLKDTKFCDKMNDYILFKNLDDKYLTLPELLKEDEKAEENTDGNTEDTKAEDTASDSEERMKENRFTMLPIRFSRDSISRCSRNRAWMQLS